MGCASLKMTKNEEILVLTQWLSPAYPVGAFSYSHGLETAISDGRIANAQDLEVWLASVVEHGSCWNDLVLLVAAYRAKSGAERADIAELALSLCPSKERVAETQLQGAAFIRTTNAVWDCELPEMPYPVAIGVAASIQNIDMKTTAYIYAHSFISNLVSATVRLVPLGQTDGQACLQRVSARVSKAADMAIDATLEELGGCTFASDIAAMAHETLAARIFQS
jgi:urease accessory protein